MEGLISVRAYKWSGLHLRGPINGGAYIGLWAPGCLYLRGPINGEVISEGAYKWRGIYL